MQNQSHRGSPKLSFFTTTVLSKQHKQTSLLRRKQATVAMGLSPPFQGPNLPIIGIAELLMHKS